MGKQISKLRKLILHNVRESNHRPSFKILSFASHLTPLKQYKKRKKIFEKKVTGFIVQTQNEENCNAFLGRPSTLHPKHSSRQNILRCFVFH